ncbi:MAG: hypothetical protein JWO86_110 [Myxococcaceae bacterium]|nr:hypothetical protein [Myxococcaceae bacterium]
MRRGLFLLVMFVASPRIAVGCSSDGGSAPPASVDSGADVVVDVAPDSSDVGVDASDPDPVPPPGLPDGWEIERKYSKHCGVYVPTTKDKLPPSIRWEACPVTSTPSGAACQLMAIDGEPADKRFPGGAEAAWVKSDGTVVLGAYRSVKPSWAYSLIAEADGAVRTAFLETDLGLCSLASASGYQDHYSLDVYEHNSGIGGGLVAGELGDFAPRLAIHLSAASAHTAYAGSLAILDLTAGFTLDQYAWPDGARLPSLWSAAQDSGLQQGIPVFTEGAAFWPSSDLRYHKVKVYTPTSGVRDFLTAGMVTTHGYGDLGTDGKDLVWIEAVGRTTDTGPFDSYTIMTAPFTTEPGVVVPRRLRTEQGPDFDVVFFQVGCGYAARSNGEHIRVVRLSDGLSWVLSNALTDPWGWTAPLAITCTELFATVRISGVTRLARVRLDSLGPGIAPD